MGKYTTAQARAKARQIHDRFGPEIEDACAGSSVPEDFLGGFCGVEAGVDHAGHISETATRFEPGVFHHLQLVRDGLAKSWSHITTADLAGSTDDALRNLATSYGLTQIMGWHMIHDLAGTIADLRDPEKHLHYAVELLNLTAGRYLRAKDFESVLRIWNSGTPTGRTYDPDYVHNALAVKAEYSKLITDNGQLTTDHEDPAAGQGETLTPAGGGEVAADPPTEQPSDDTARNSAAAPLGEQPKRSWWDRATGWQGRVDQVNSWRNSLNPFTPSLSPISGASSAATWSTKIMGWVTFATGFLTHNWIYLAAGVVLVSLALAYLAMAKRNAALRMAGESGQTQQQTVVVKPAEGA